MFPLHSKHVHMHESQADNYMALVSQGGYHHLLRPSKHQHFLLGPT